MQRSGRTKLVPRLDGSAERSLDAGFVQLGLMLLTMAVIKHLGEYLLRVAGERLVADVRLRLFQALLAQEVSFFDHSPTGALVSVLSADVEAIQLAVALNLPDVVRYGVSCACAAVSMAYISPRLASLGLLAGPPIGVPARVRVRVRVSLAPLGLPAGPPIGVLASTARWCWCGAGGDAGGGWGWCGAEIEWSSRCH